MPKRTTGRAPEGSAPAFEPLGDVLPIHQAVLAHLRGADNDALSRAISTSALLLPFRKPYRLDPLASEFPTKKAVLNLFEKGSSKIDATGCVPGQISGLALGILAVHDFSKAEQLALDVVAVANAPSGYRTQAIRVLARSTREDALRVLIEYPASSPDVEVACRVALASSAHPDLVDVLVSRLRTFVCDPSPLGAASVGRALYALHVRGVDEHVALYADVFETTQRARKKAFDELSKEALRNVVAIRGERAVNLCEAIVAEGRIFLLNSLEQLALFLLLQSEGVQAFDRFGSWLADCDAQDSGRRDLLLALLADPQMSYAIPVRDIPLTGWQADPRWPRAKLTE